MVKTELLSADMSVSSDDGPAAPILEEREFEPVGADRRVWSNPSFRSLPVVGREAPDAVLEVADARMSDTDGEVPREGEVDNLGLEAGTVEEAIGDDSGLVADERMRMRARMRLAECDAPSPSHPFRAHMDGVRRALKAQGLPTRAEGARIYVVEHGPMAGAVLRAAAGPCAPGFGASARLIDAGAGTAISALLRRSSTLGSTQTITALLARTYRQAVEMQSRALRVCVAAHLHVGFPRVAVATLPASTSIEDLAHRAAQQVLNGTRPEGLTRELTRRLQHAPTASPADVETLARIFADGLAVAVQDAELRARLEDAWSQLQSVVNAARASGVLPIVGVPQSFGGRADYAAPADASVDGMLRVGAGNLPRAREGSAERVGPLVDIVAPGYSVPVRHAGDGNRVPLDGSGSVFAAPFVAGVAAMLARVDEEMKVDELERRLRAAGDALGDVVPVVAAARDDYRARIAAQIANVRRDRRSRTSS